MCCSTAPSIFLILHQISILLLNIHSASLFYESRCFNCVTQIIIKSGLIKSGLTDIYKFLQPSYMFTDKEHRGPFEFSDELGNLSIGGEAANNVVSAQRVEENDKDLLLTTSEKEETRGSTNNGSAYTAPYDSSSTSVFASQTLIELAPNPTAAGHSAQASFAIDDLLGLDLPAAPAPAPPSPQLKLNTKAALDPSTFQQKWRQLPVALSQVCL